MGEKEEEERDISSYTIVLLGRMENHRDSVTPPLSQFSPKTTIDEKGLNLRKRGRREEAMEDKAEGLHKERDRREKMTEKFTMLQSLVPNLFPKATREKIIGETIEYIKHLEKERKRMEELEKPSKSVAAKGSISQCTNWKSSVSVAASGGDVVLFEIQSWARRRLVVEIFMVFEKYGAEILAANVAVDRGNLTLSVTAIVNGGGDEVVEWIKREILAL